MPRRHRQCLQGRHIQNWGTELGQTAWQGSIDFQSSNGSMLAQTAMPLSDVTEAISVLLGSAGEKANAAKGTASTLGPRRERHPH
jgi:hypothetical protein